MSAAPVTHFRVRYFRPSWQGGDAEHPLCATPLVGWSGHLASLSMADVAAKVDCPHCRRELDLGGLSARRARLARRYIGREGEAA